MKSVATTLALVLAAASLAGCPKPAPRPDGKTRVLCATFPIYLFTRAVTAGRDTLAVDLMLPGPSGCPHDYALAPGDMKKIAASDIFVANGLGMESFLGAPLRQGNPKIALLDSSAGIADLIPMKDEDPEAAGAAEHRHGMNPHLFASPRTAAKVVRNIAEKLAVLDPPGAEVYRKNAAAYAGQLDALADEFSAAVAALPARKIVTEHAVFDYLARDCGLQIVAVVEENPGQEPSAAGMRKIIETIKGSAAAAVFTEPQYPAAVGRAIAREASVPVAVLDPVAGGPEGAAPDYYLKAMRGNLQTLRKTLGGKDK